MAHLSMIQDDILNADAHYIADVKALNNSGVTGTVFATIEGDILSIAVDLEGLAPDQVHIQHVHGLFDAEGNPIDSVAPTQADDVDLDGFVEVSEGAAAYGDILLPIEDQSDGFNNDPVADADGNLAFYGQFDLTDDSLFLNPLSGTEYTGADLLPLELREFVVHGQQIDQAFGAGTDGSIDGTTGYKLSLPVAAAGFDAVSRDAALDILQDEQADADAGTAIVEGTPDDDIFEGVVDGTTTFGLAGTDTLELEGPRDAFGVVDQPSGLVEVTDLASGDAAAFGSVERIAFDDATLLFELGDAADAVYLLLQAALGGTPDEARLTELAGLAEAGVGIRSIAEGLTASPDFDPALADAGSDADYVDALFEEILERPALGAGAAFWENALGVEGFDRTDAFVAFALSAENRAQESESFEDGYLVA